MERKNYFEILGLEFDPPEKNDQRIRKAIEEWKKRVSNALANETIDSRREQLQQELMLEADMTATLKDTKLRNTEARALKEQRIAQLEKLIDILRMGQTGTPEVSNAQIRNVQQKLRLSAKTVTDTYVKKGFAIQKKAEGVKLAEVFMSTSVFNKLEGDLAQLRKLKSPQFPWAAKVNDLFDLACYACNEGDDATASYHRKRTTDLCSIMSSWAAQLASDMSAQGHLMADIFTTGSSQVFNSEANRKKYEMSMQREKLREFFSLLKSAPDEFKKDHDFAESCIATIQKSFPEYNLALALYNHEAGLLQDPYEPLTAMIHVSCGTCKTPAQFRTREAAESARCATCGAELFILCPQCRKKVPAIADRCACGFLISEMQFFDEYLRDAEYALKSMNLGEAERLIRCAETAYPGHPKIAPLKQKIQSEAKRYQKPMDDLKALIADGLFVKAQAQIAAITSSMPQLRLDKERQIIADKLKEAQNRMPGAAMAPSDAANRCVDVLEIVRDYQPAIDFLQSPKGTPRPVSKLCATTRNGTKLTCVLSWTASGDRGVQYYVVRKKNGLPANRTDGETLASGLSALEYQDNSIEPGVSYGYAVFAGRYGNFSGGVTCEVVNFSELDAKHLEAVAEDGACRFSWTLPPNAIGVRILRARGGIPGEVPGGNCEVIAACAPNNYSDRSVSNNNQYGYRLQCIYPYGGGNRYSHGYTTMLMPEEPPVGMRNVTAKVENRTVTVQWTPPDEKRRTVMIRECLGANARSLKGKVLALSDINTALGGRVLADISSNLGRCQMEILPNSSMELAVISVAGAKGVISEILQVSSVERVEINKSTTRVVNGKLHIVLQKTPQHLQAIHYCVAVKMGKDAPWAKTEDAKRGTMTVITADQYNRDGLIEVNKIPLEDLYISVIGQYKMPNGSVVYSEASRHRVSNKPKDTIYYSLNWGSGGFFGTKLKPKDCKLNLRVPGKEIPELKLVYRTDGHIPMRLKDPRVQVLHVIPEGECPGISVLQLPDHLWTALAPETELRLMLEDEDMVAYDLIAEEVEKLKVPKG